MPTIYSDSVRYAFTGLIILSLFLMPVLMLRAQSECVVTKVHGRGYSSTITSVTDNGDDSYTIVLTVEHDGCPGPYCKELSHYSIEAEEDTYDNVSVEVLSGSMTYCGIDMGHNLGGDPFDGFKVDDISGIGDGLAGVFTVTYTLTGGLQQQKTLVKAGNKRLTVCFTLEEFQAVLECGSSDIIPYYPPPEGGKILNSLIGAELTSLYESYSDTANYDSNEIFQIVDSLVLIEIHALENMYEDLLSLLITSSYGLTEELGDPDLLLITGLFPINNLLLLNDLPGYLEWARPVYPAIFNSGLITSQGDTAMRSYIARDAFHVTGDGVKVGVMSDSYNKKLGNPASDDIIKGDLPGPTNPINLTAVDVLADYPYGSGSDEGRAMLQIIHDIAPKAELAFRTGFISALDFAAGIRELQLAGCDVIVDDITYITEPFFDDGLVAQTVDEVVSDGVAYFSAAGNFGARSYQNVFSPATPPPGINGDAHNFATAGPADIHQSISLSQGSYTIVLQWDDGSDFNETSTDLDIYLSNENGTTLFGFNRNNTGIEPIEVLPFTVTAETAESNILIARASGVAPVTFKYIVFRGNLVMNEYGNTGISTLVGQANASGAIAVGAVLYSNTPEFGVDPPTIASFSSVGGTPVNGTARNKPEITAPNGGNTSVNLGGFNIDGDLFPNFFGTSAAAPHAAGVAALLLEAKSTYYDTNMVPAELRGILQNTALDMITPGYDVYSGYGFIQADAALNALANPSPVITTLVYDTTIVPGTEPLEITVTGKYLTSGSVIYFNGSALDSTTTLLGDTAISAVVPVFEERYPPIQVYNPPLAGTNGTDGGFSNPLYFTTKKTIVISIHDTTKFYGQVMPEFTASFTIESLDGPVVTLEEEGLSQEAVDRIHAIELVTVATALSNAGIWEIKASPDDPLNPVSVIPPSDSLDLALLETYNIYIERGLLPVEKLDLLITPRDTTITFGDSITGFKYDYLFNTEVVNPEQLIEINEADSLAILNLLQQSHATALVNAIGLVRATALVNDQGDPMLDSANLVNKSVVVSNALLTQRATALVNGTLIDPPAFLNAVLGSQATALVNGFATLRATALVNGTATALVNGSSTALVNASSLSLATALVNTTTVSETNNNGAILLLDEGDISILAGDSIGNIVLNSISLITGDSAGVHWIIPGSLLSINFNISYGLAKLTVEPDTAGIAFDLESLTQIYDGTAKVALVATEPPGLQMEITYDGETTPPVDAGTYAVIATIDDQNFVGSDEDTLFIFPAQAIVTANNKVIKAGDPAPSYTATFSGFVNGEEESVVTDINFSLEPQYCGAAGTYEIIPDATADNYIFTPVSGSLYVNPYGWGAKQIKVSLVCVEELDADSLGFSYLAHFEYKNENATDVFIPVGDKNKLISSGSYYGNTQPKLFLSGGGTFDILFDGNLLKWRVKSYHNYFLLTSLAQANNCSPSCYKSSQVAEGEIVTPQDGDGFMAYPNPTGGLVFIDLKGKEVIGNEVAVYDQFGKICPIDPVQSTSGILEIDLSGLRAGLYFVKVIHGEKKEVFRIIKY